MLGLFWVVIKNTGIFLGIIHCILFSTAQTTIAYYSVNATYCLIYNILIVIIQFADAKSQRDFFGYRYAKK